MIAREMTRKKDLFRNLFYATRIKIVEKLSYFLPLPLASFHACPADASARRGMFRGLTIYFLVSAFCILHSAFLFAQTPYYYINRSFSEVQFNLQGIPTEYQLSQESDKLTDIIDGEIKLDTTNTYAIEKQVTIAVGYGSALSAWNAATNYTASTSKYDGQIFDNVGWVRGTRSVSTNWGAYLWVLQNRIKFQAGTSEWWSTTNGIPVRITNVMVGSLGNYPPTNNVDDLGPVIPTNFPGANLGDVGTYQVDITNVFYELVIPDIWITPRDAVTSVDGSNVEFEVTGTNIPLGVTWTIYPTNFEGHAGFQSATNYYAEVIPGSVATNYKVRATDKDNTNFWDEVSLAVVGLQSPMQYKISTNSWSDMPDPLYVCKDTTVDFKVIKTPTNASWPSGKPVWGGVLNGSGMESNSYVFNSLSTNETGYIIVSAECGNVISGKVSVIDVRLKSVSYGGSGEHNLRKDGENWNDDSYTSDGDTEIVDPVWVDSDLDGTADKNEPVCYTKASSPLLNAVIYVSPTTGISSISSRLKAMGTNASLAYLKDITLSSGDNECNSLTTSNSLWNYITNLNISLLWSISLDDGKSYKAIGVSDNIMNVVYDTPNGLITAKRINWCTTLAAGKNTLEGIGNAIGPDATSGSRFSVSNSVYGDPITWPWSVMDGTNADCVTLSWLMKYELDCVGATNAAVWIVYPRHASWSGLSSQTVPPVESETNEYSNELVIYRPSSGMNYYEGCCVFQTKWWLGGFGTSTNSAYSVLRYMADPNTNGSLSLSHQCWDNDTTNFVTYPEGIP